MALPTQANVTNPHAWGYGASLDNGGGQTTDVLYLRLADGPDRVSGIQTADLPKLPASQENPEDFQAESGYMFSRSLFSGGAGLDRAHRRDATERDFSRFWDSRNVKVEPAEPGTPETLQLLPETAKKQTATSTNLHLARIGTTLYWPEGNDVKRCADPTGAWTVTSEDPEAGGGTPGTVGGLAVLGDQLYAALGAASEGIHVRSNAGTWTHWSDLNATAVWSVKGRILASTGTVLYEAAADAGSVSLGVTLPSGQTWLDACDAGTMILAAASDGQIYSWSEESGSLLLRGQQSIEGEIPCMIGVAQGYVFVGTYQSTIAGGKIGRLWVGEVVGTRVANLQLVRTWGSSTETRDRSPYGFYATRDSIFCAVIEDGTETHLWRFNLRSAGFTRDLICTGVGACQGVTAVDDRLFAALSGVGVFREETTLATEGWLIGPLADFYTTQPKQWVGARLSTDALAAEQTVTLYHSTDRASITDRNDAGWTQTVQYTAATTAATRAAEHAIAATDSQWLASMLVLVPSDDQTTGPTVLSYSYRALPIPVDVLLTLYVNVSDVIERPFRKPLRVPEQGKRVFNELKDNWEGQYVSATLFRPPITVAGQVEKVATPVAGHTTRGSATLYSAVQIKGTKT